MSNTKPVALGPREAALGAHFKRVRREKKVWLKPLSKNMRCSLNSIRWHEAGARMFRLDMLARAADAIGVPLDELVKLPNDEKET